MKKSAKEVEDSTGGFFYTHTRNKEDFGRRLRISHAAKQEIKCVFKNDLSEHVEKS